jgi:glycosyltransferase involved in cell wall biosynthesis
MAWDREERQLLPRCAGVITATDEVGRRYRDLHPLCMTIKNFPKLSELTVVPFALRRPDTCVFTGTIKENRGIREALLAFRILARKGRSINFFIAGMCEEKYLRTIKEYIREFDIEPLVKFFGKLTHEESISLASYSTLGLIPHLPYGNNMAAWPVKMMEYLGLGLPVIYSDLPSHMEIAGPREVGMTVDARRPECIAEAIETMIDNPRLLERAGENARQRALEALDWGGESKKLLRFYRTILAPSGIHQPLHA